MPLEYQKKHVEHNANILLKIIKEHPNLKVAEITEHMGRYMESKPFETKWVTKYLNALVATGHLVGVGVQHKSYRVIKSEPFVYPNNVKDFLRLPKNKQREAVK